MEVRRVVERQVMASKRRGEQDVVQEDRRGQDEECKLEEDDAGRQEDGTGSLETDISLAEEIVINFEKTCDQSVMEEEVEAVAVAGCVTQEEEGLLDVDQSRGALFVPTSSPVERSIYSRGPNASLLQFLFVNEYPAFRKYVNPINHEL